MEFVFLNPAGTTLFVRSDLESGHWVEEQMNLTASFPLVADKLIQIGQWIAFRDPVTDILQVFEIVNVTNQEPEHFQQITAEHVAIAELSDEHINSHEITDNTPAQALETVLVGTLWSVGNILFGTVEEKNMLQEEITALALNGNVDLTNRPIVLPETMHNAGYTDFDGDYATLYSMTYTLQTADEQDCTLLATPIKQDGTVLTQNDIDDYVDTLCSESANINAIKGNDTQGLLIHVLSGTQIETMDEIAEQAHDLSDQWEQLTEGELSSVDISRGSVWQAVNAIAQNWNVYITPRIVISSAGVITGRYLDIALAEGTWRGLRLSIRKNMIDPSVIYDESEVYTALYGYGGSVEVPQQSGDDETEELTFADVVWTATMEHPAKPSGQTYLEWPEKTALYGRNGRPRFGYYQNSSITDAETLLEKTWESLKQSSSPKVSISGTVVDLYRMGYKDQPIRLHDTAIIEIEETGEILQKQIICNDVDLLDPTGTRIEAGDYIPNIVYINRDTDQKASGGGGGGGGRSKGSMTEYQGQAAYYKSEFVKNDQLIGMIVGIHNGVKYIKSGEIVIAINDTTGETMAKIKADHVWMGTGEDSRPIDVVIDGKLDVDELAARIAAISILNTLAIHADGNIVADGGISAASLAVNQSYGITNSGRGVFSGVTVGNGGVTVNGTALSVQSITVVTPDGNKTISYLGTAGTTPSQS
jgi:hypothetical protein